MLSLDALLAEIPARPDVEALLGEFVPPARFADKRFAGYHPRDPSQSAAQERLQRLAEELRAADGGVLGRLKARWRGPVRGGGVYLDGGFGVGKTHLLASLWHAAPFPKAYLGFDSFVQVAAFMGDARFRDLFLDQRLVCVDEWELDDPGNLTLSLSVLRELLAHGVRIVATSNTLPLELGAGRFSQKDFKTEIAEMAGAFEVITVGGEDYRHRHFELNPGREYFVDPEVLEQRARAAGKRALLVPFGELLEGLATLHPLRYIDLIHAISAVFILDFGRIDDLPGAIRFVHFIDRLYNSAVPLAASSDAALTDLFPASFLSGPYGKKCSRCLSRLEELLSGAVGT